MEKNEILSLIEGLIFIGGDEGITAKDVADVLDVSKKEAVVYLDDLIALYNAREVKGFDIANFGGVYRMVTRPEHDEYYRKLIATGRSHMSKSALETLAIVAYYQPITRVQIEDIRGVGCEGMVRKLVGMALIKEMGRADTPGRPILYGVTDEFLNAFHLTSLDELPELKDIAVSDDDEDLFATKYTEDKEQSEPKDEEA